MTSIPAPPCGHLLSVGYPWHVPRETAGGLAAKTFCPSFCHPVYICISVFLFICLYIPEPKSHPNAALTTPSRCCQPRYPNVHQLLITIYLPGFTMLQQKAKTKSKSNYMYTCRYICLVYLVCPYVHPSVYLSAFLSVCTSVRRINLSACLFV